MQLINYFPPSLPTLLNTHADLRSSIK